MAPKNTKRTTKKPILIKCGNHFINPSDIRKITEVKKRDDRKTIYVVDFISSPNPEWACWVKAEDIDMLLSHFEVIVSDER